MGGKELAETLILPSGLPQVLSFCALLFLLQEPVAIGTGQVDLIVSIGMQTPLGFSHAEEEPGKRFSWSPGSLATLAEDTVHLHSLSSQDCSPFSGTGYPARESANSPAASWGHLRASAVFLKISQWGRDGL